MRWELVELVVMMSDKSGRDDGQSELSVNSYCITIVVFLVFVLSEFPSQFCSEFLNRKTCHHVINCCKPTHSATYKIKSSD